MSLTKLTENLNNIASLPDKPSVEATALKQLFDKAGNDIKSYINQVLTEELDTLIASNYTTLNNRINANASTITSAQLDKIYPVGSIYMSVNTTDPSQLMGGTWERIKDKFLLASGDNYENGSTGGEATHQLTENEMPSHKHVGNYNFQVWANKESDGSPYFPLVIGKTSGGSASGFVLSGSRTGSAIISERIGFASSGNDQAHNNMPPYLAVYIWKRIS